MELGEVRLAEEFLDDAPLAVDHEGGGRQAHLLEAAESDIVIENGELKVAGTDRKKAFAALKASAMLAVRQGLRGGRLWVDHSWEFRNREDLLIPLPQWKKERQRLISA